MFITLALLINTFLTIKKILPSREKTEEWVKVIMAIYEKQMQIKNSHDNPSVLVTAFYKFLLEYAEIFDADPNDNNLNLSADNILNSSKKILDANSERYILSTSYAKVSPFFPTPFLYLDKPILHRESISDFTATKVDISNLLKSSKKEEIKEILKDLLNEINSYFELLKNRSSLAKGKVASLNTNENRMAELFFNSCEVNDYYWGGDKCNVYVGDSLFYAFKKLYLSYTNDKRNDLDFLLVNYIYGDLLSGHIRYQQPGTIAKNTHFFETCDIGSKIEPGYLICISNDGGSTYGHIEIVLSPIDKLENGISFVTTGAHKYGVYRTTRTFKKKTMIIKKFKEDTIKNVLNIPTLKINKDLAKKKLVNE